MEAVQLHGGLESLVLSLFFHISHQDSENDPFSVVGALKIREPHLSFIQGAKKHRSPGSPGLVVTEWQSQAARQPKWPVPRLGFSFWDLFASRSPRVGSRVLDGSQELWERGAITLYILEQEWVQGQRRFLGLHPSLWTPGSLPSQNLNRRSCHR